MAMCPACNGLISSMRACDGCGQSLKIYGRIYDYQDDYSAYEEYDLTNETKSPTQENGCPHYVGCEACRSSYIYIFMES
ncbi:hypothetical protein AB3N04_07895 [Alkalihalophilus sp. As8PL]|uniref:Uncharacterized protein n=1 Tax=Alkalihalophilus sp. As8PL TaxID=3237103 RepID=A0AB39BXJ8_9BACI